MWEILVAVVDDILMDANKSAICSFINDINFEFLSFLSGDDYIPKAG